MKVFYFSGTGNSMHAANEIAAKLGVTTAAIENNPVIEGGKACIVFPCYCGSVPDIVYGWICRQKLKELEHLSLVCTCGASSGDAYVRILSIVGESTKMYAKDLVMPDSCIIFATAKNRVDKIFDNFNVNIDEIVKNIKSESDNSLEYKSKKIKSFNQKFMWACMNALGLKKKKADKKCVQCGKCERNCPTKSINIYGGKVTFNQETCADCFRCIQICPQRAISYGIIKVRKNGRKVYNYVNPHADFK